MDDTLNRTRDREWLAAVAAVLTAASVALLAYAAHGSEGEAQARLQTAAVFGFGHGVAIAALAPWSRRRLARLALFALLAGVLLFSGSLYLLTLSGIGKLGIITPFGGVAFLFGWLCLGLSAWKLT
jgi:uncharacterized membrane protein YgdD (TMEM256/DUF423 family)